MLNSCISSWGGYGYIVSKKAIPLLIETISQEKKQVDTYYTTLMPRLKWFKTKQFLVKHLAGYSTIEEKHRDIKELY